MTSATSADAVASPEHTPQMPIPTVSEITPGAAATTSWAAAIAATAPATTRRRSQRSESASTTGSTKTARAMGTVNNAAASAPVDSPSSAWRSAEATIGPPPCSSSRKATTSRAVV